MGIYVGSSSSPLTSTSARPKLRQKMEIMMTRESSSNKNTPPQSMVNYKVTVPLYFITYIWLEHNNVAIQASF